MLRTVGPRSRCRAPLPSATLYGVVGRGAVRLLRRGGGLAAGGFPGAWRPTSTELLWALQLGESRTARDGGGTVRSRVWWACTFDW